MDIKQAIARVIDGHDLDGPDMTACMRAIMTGGATPAQIAGFLVACGSRARRCPRSPPRRA
jgi:anthranilate phosphoribosyltransferase